VVEDKLGVPKVSRAAILESKDTIAQLNGKLEKLQVGGWVEGWWYCTVLYHQDYG